MTINIFREFREISSIRTPVIDELVRKIERVVATGLDVNIPFMTHSIDIYVHIHNITSDCAPIMCCVGLLL